MITLSPEAAKKIEAEALAANELPRLRVGIEGGGCSGFKYLLGFESEAAAPDDQEFVHGPVTVVVDLISLQYLNGAHIDYELDLTGERIVIKNPNAHQTCSCGSSFS